ncbi:hypothetical protein COU57_06535 [Candidatus Pacearchaeota archaeon CG10_big_fil_rev_8_21_14_0_10_32_14]|nr:MAG: hypothetical protein COU57_06535 [Candidatus Pacearchaeota archaeon CG10_big_fil_rev_8_21_14_0_10_32_14]
MIAQNTLFFAVNIALIFGIFFTIFVLIVVRMTQIMPRKRRSGSGSTIAIVITTILITFVITVFMTNAFTGNVSAQENTNNVQAQDNIEQSIDRVNYLMSQSQADKAELQQLKYELEDALNKLRQQHPNTKHILIPTGGVS